jgi:hypothetical protein
MGLGSVGASIHANNPLANRRGAHRGGIAAVLRLIQSSAAFTVQ